jgi:hypothetical protein
MKATVTSSVTSPTVAAIRKAIDSLATTPPRDSSEAYEIARELNELGRELAAVIAECEAQR